MTNLAHKQSDAPEPDRASLEIMHRKHHFNMPLDDMLKHPTFSMVIKNMARKHMMRRTRIDHKAIAANN